MDYRPILSTLGYVLSPDRTRVLLTHRVSRSGDEQFGKYNGLGGRMEPSEGVADCMRREIREEAGLEVVRMQLRGTINWTGFGSSGQDWLGFVFLIYFNRRAKNYRDRHPGEKNPIDRWMTGKDDEKKDDNDQEL